MGVVSIKVECGRARDALPYVYITNFPRPLGKPLEGDKIDLSSSTSYTVVESIGDPMLTLTPAATEKIQTFFQTEETAKGKALRVKLQPSGCAA